MHALGMKAEVSCCFCKHVNENTGVQIYKCNKALATTPSDKQKTVKDLNVGGGILCRSLAGKSKEIKLKCKNNMADSITLDFIKTQYSP